MKFYTRRSRCRRWFRQLDLAHFDAESGVRSQLLTYAPRLTTVSIRQRQREKAMARPLRIEYPGAFYHVASRGDERKNIFVSSFDRERFLGYLESSVVRYNVVVHVWRLMDNHYHLLIETPSGNLSRIMRHINGACTTYFNIRRQRAGHLFQGRYKAIVVEADAYAAELSRYLHLNPVRAGLLHRPEEYPWSSYRAYIGRCLPPDWLTTSLVLGYFGGDTQEARNRYCKFVEDRILCEYETPLKNTVGSTVLGTPEYVEMITSERLPEHSDMRDIPAIRQLTPRLSLNETLEKIEACFGQTGRLLRDLSKCQVLRPDPLLYK